MFDALSDRFEGIFGQLRNRGRLNESDVDEVLREIRLALLEADVNVTVVRSLQSRIRERCVGAEASEALTSSQQIIKVVNEELTATLGGETMRLTYASKPPTVVLMAGLQGSGKTTNSAKLARWFKAQGRNPLLVGADLQRPAAVEQLRTLAGQIDVPVFSEPSDPVAVAAAGLAEAQRTGRDVLICDTAGRLSIDQELMEEVRQISGAIEPDYTFLVIDAMTGQDAVQTAESFHSTLELDGVILTKLDGDARGGAALSVKEVVGRPIAFASTGERLEDFDQFHPDRLAGRILGMGDMLTLIEKAEEVYEEEQAEAAAARLMEGTFTPRGLPGPDAGHQEDGSAQQRHRHAARHPQRGPRRRSGRQRSRPDRGHHPLDDSSRANRPRSQSTGRVAPASRWGSGTNPSEVAQLLSQFKEMQKMMQQMGGGTVKKMKRKNAKRKGKGKGKGKSKGGGRTTPKGTKSKSKTPYRLPGLDAAADQIEKLGIDLPEGP